MLTEETLATEDIVKTLFYLYHLRILHKNTNPTACIDKVANEVGT